MLTNKLLILEDLLMETVSLVNVPSHRGQHLFKIEYYVTIVIIMSYIHYFLETNINSVRTRCVVQTTLDILLCIYIPITGKFHGLKATTDE